MTISNVVANIVHVPKKAILTGEFYCPNPYVLISISESHLWPEVHKDVKPPSEIHRFDFGDIDDHEEDPELLESLLFSEEDCSRIVEIYTQCLLKGIDIVAHCSAGISRSGAIAEVAELIGFNCPVRHMRIPNVYVKAKLLTACLDHPFLSEMLRTTAANKRPFF